MSISNFYLLFPSDITYFYYNNLLQKYNVIVFIAYF